jgi:sporulation protein YlmC with PRC-barrel domain
MFDERTAESLRGRDLVDGSGEPVGRIEDVFLFPAADQAAWAAVEVDGALRAVPLADADVSANPLRVRFDRATIAGAPEAAGDSLETSRELYEHYGLSDAELRDDDGGPTDAAKAGQGSSRDPRGGSGADDAAQGHP